MLRRSLPLAAAALVAAAAGAHAQGAAAPPPVDPSLFAALRYRMVGPARGGRVTAITGVPSQPMTFYFGSTGGGVWKTDDAGANWRNVSDGFFTEGSIGAVEVAQSDPNVVYVGTGSDGLRSNVSTGHGMYKSTDAGRTWKWTGLRDAGQIAIVRVHPRDPNTVFAAAIGNAFKPNPERGLFKSDDGGATWRKVLFVSDSTGAVDVEFQPGNPSVLYASMWRAERKPWTIISGAREGGIYKSTDGGETWKKLGGGLPTGLFGKSNVAVSAAAPNRVYALVEAKPGSGLYRSDDAGESWTLINTQPTLITRPFYYTTLGVDPTNADVVYAGAEGFFKSTDGGRSFRPMSTPHGDNHDIWISPRDGRIMIQSNDGGANVSLNGGQTWSTQYNQPTAEIYQVYLDNQYPYRLYGAQQDNSTVIVPSLPTTGGPPDDPVQSWRQGPGCETGPIFPHATNPDTVYGSCKGQFSRMSLRTGQEKQYWIGGESLYGNPGSALTYRFQRVSPMEFSPHDPSVIYYGSQYVHRTRDEGVTWERISPDLTANDPKYRDYVAGEPITIDVTGEEYYAVVYAIEESPLERGVIWTGANDGPYYVTRDNGKTWTNVTPPDLPKGCRVQSIDPSPHRRGSAYYASLCYQLGDFRPYAYKTDDYGKTWRRLTTGTNGVPADYPTRVVREDPSRPGLLYLGTEFGMFVSFDDGARWQPFQQNLPATPVTDLKVHQKDLVLSTQGRAFWIMDNLTPLHQIADAAARARMAQAPAHLFAPREAIRARYRAGFGGLESDRASSVDPQYPPAGAQIDYWLAKAPGGALTLEILDSAGTLVRSYTSAGDEPPAAGRGGGRFGGAAARPSTRAGLNRFTWDFSYPGPTGVGGEGAGGRGGSGPLAVPGRYSVRLKVANADAGTKEWTMTQPLVLRIDPRVAKDGVTPAVLKEQLAHNLRARDMVSEVNRLVGTLRAAHTRLQGAGGAAADSLRRVEAVEAKLLTPPVRYSQPGLQAHIQYLYGMTNQADQKIGRDAVERLAELRKQLDAVEAEARAVLGASAVTAATGGR